jgi:hypothetical protein
MAQVDAVGLGYGGQSAVGDHVIDFQARSSHKFAVCR